MDPGPIAAGPAGLSTDGPPPILAGRLNPAFFLYLQNLYAARTGFHLVLSDLNGSIQMGLPDCDRFPCFSSCRDCREQIVAESLRTGRVCLDRCREGYVLWGLPFAVEGRPAGGIIVIGGTREIPPGQEDRFTHACAELHALSRKHGLLDGLSDGGAGESTFLHRFIYRDSFMRLRREIEVHGAPLIAALQTAEFATAERHFEGIKLAFRNNADLPIDLLKGLTGDLIFRARQQLTDGGMDAYACFAEAGLLMEQVSIARHPAQMEVILDAFFGRFIQLSRQRPKDPDELVIQKATTYMEQHIREDLTRESVARAVGISPSQFSRLIREKKGRTFTDLLNQYRIEHASKLLVRTNLTLAHIASEAGFCDQSYFSKVFRRYKDVTPAEFRTERR